MNQDRPLATPSPSANGNGAQSREEENPEQRLSTARLASISLPKGGGAIRGMGEKFEVNPATGTGSFSIPLPSSSARSDFGPKLSLAYDSGSGNGPFGFGWSLGVPAITRKTDKGLPRYHDGEDSDTFLISGAEDLVPILNAAGQRFSLPRTLHTVAYTVSLYRPRIDGLFSRIERWTRVDNQQSHWRTITRDNVTSVFGFDDNARIFDPRDPARIFSYLIQLSFDNKGNAIQYEYLPEDSAGVDASSAHEANRTVASRRSQRYLKFIRYGNVAPYFPDWSPAGVPTQIPQNWHFQIVFDYGDHRANNPTPVRNAALDPVWRPRLDPFSTYRAGFEVRTYRRCKRVLMFHQFAGQGVFNNPTLVRSTDFTYSDEVRPADPRNPLYTFIESVTQKCYRDAIERSTPPLEFSYTQPEVNGEILTLSDSDSRENLPEGLASNFRFVDLDGEGLAGILSAQDGCWSYKRNLSPINQVTLPSGERVARAQFAPAEEIPSLPVPADLSGGQQLLDVTGEGRLDLVNFSASVPGFFERTSDNDWEPLQPFKSLPSLNWSEPNLKFVDLTGDGQADVLITEDDVFTFYPSLGTEGFGDGERVFNSVDEERGPRVVFADQTQTVSLADVSGDGLQDIVRVRNGEVCYWPNLGYGRFGAKVTMDNAPRFTDEERFDSRRVRLADVDGTGTTDLLYVGDDGVQVCFNRSGNTWAAPHRLAIFPSADSLGDLQVADLLGNGTACLVWSSPLPAEAYQPLRYVDLMGSRKPHLLVRVRNNLGAETRLSYAPSTRFYLEDKRAGKPWITRLAFPVQVVDRVETYDWIGRSRFVSQYAYHHGFFDGEEREFRGFGMVEQRDTETHRDDTLFPEVEPANEDATSFAPPVLTRTWFHTGAFVEAGIVSRQYESEYWVEPALRGNAPAAVAARAAMLLPDSVIDGAVSPREMREAYRALKGSKLRVEVYAEDASANEANPFTVTEQNFAARRLQPHGPNRYAVFLTHARESLTYHYERQADDPRVAHNLTLEVDEFANVKRAVSVAYPRRAGHPAPEPDLSLSFRTMLDHDQSRLRVSGTENVFTDPVNRPEQALIFDEYRAPQPAEMITAELTGIAPVADRFSFTEMDANWTTWWSGANDIPYEQIATADIDGAGAVAGLARRIVEHTRTLYRSNDLTTLLALRGLQSLALPGEAYRLALTPGLVTRIFGAGVITDPILLEAGYFRFAGETDWWMPSGRLFYSAGDADLPPVELNEARTHFFQPRRAIDPFGSITRVDFDGFDLLPRTYTDAAGNFTTADNDYRVLQPFRTTDANGNRSEVAYNCLGQVAGTAVSGKAGEGDSLFGFNPDLSDADIQALKLNPFADPVTLLGNATTRVVYDHFGYFRTRASATPDALMVYTLSRETHVSDLNGGATLFQHAFGYWDGLARQAQLKAQAEPGPVAGAGPNVSPRWVSSGWTIYNNKGKPVRKYEPFFTTTHNFEFNRLAGVSSIFFYDPAERVVATLRPDNTFDKTIFEAWREENWDANDTISIADPRVDPHVGDHFLRLLGTAPNVFTSWHDRRITGTFGATPEERAASQDAATKAAAHSATPAVTHFDALGRACLAVVHNGLDAGVAKRFATRTVLDVENKPLAVIDARERRVMEFCRREPVGGGGFRYVAGYDLAGNALYRNGMDDGERRTLNNIVGKPARSFDARGFVFRTRYDALHRTTHRFAARGGGAEVLLERIVYGDKHPDLTRNLKGKVFRHYDAAGLATSERYDFKGNLVESARQFAQLNSPAVAATFYETTADWTPINVIVDAPALDVNAIDLATAPLLVNDDRFVTFSRFDALNRPIQIVTPHRTTAPANQPSVVRPAYNEANLMERIDVWIRQAAAPAVLLDPLTADIRAVNGVEYNERGQRLSITHGNQVQITYDYDRETFKLRTLTTTRPNTFAANERTVQELSYQYDPVGNVTRIRDTADIQNVVFFRNQRVEPSADYTYDPLYRLIAATGREHLGQAGAALNPAVQPTNDDSPRTHSAPNVRFLSPGDGNAMGNYTERYEYDAVGNLMHLIHQVASGGWTRHYQYTEPSLIDVTQQNNRLSANSLPGDAAAGPFSAPYTHDEHGNMIRMPHLPRLTYDADNRLQSTTRQVVAAGMPETTHYSYDSEGQRIRKATFWQAAAGVQPNRKSERLYLGFLEIFREYDAGGNLIRERETLNVMDDKDRLVMVETRTLGVDPGPPQLIRYQYTNQLSSAILELDDAGDVISYEEYFPYGATSYQAVRSQVETPKRYRFTGKERDEETDLYYHGARYYIPWLGRWAAADPAGLTDGNNLYAYARDNPVTFVDRNGHDSTTPSEPEVVSNTQPRFQLTMPSIFGVSVGGGSVDATFVGQARVAERTHQTVRDPATQGRTDTYTSSAYLNTAHLRFSTNNYSLSLDATGHIDSGFFSPGPGSWATDLRLQARITPRLARDGDTLNLLDINATARTAFLSVNVNAHLRTRPFQSVGTYAGIAQDLVRGIGRGDFVSQLRHHALGTLGTGLDFSASLRVLGVPTTYAWGSISESTDVHALGLVYAPAGTLFPIAAPLVGGATFHSGPSVDYSLRGGVLPLLSPSAISAGEPPERMFPVYLYGKGELSLSDVRLPFLGPGNLSLGVEGSLNFADVLAPRPPQQPTQAELIDQYRGVNNNDNAGATIKTYLQFSY
jgi:RHS repeat-associated protein